MNGKCTHKRAYAQIWTDIDRYEHVSEICTRQGEWFSQRSQRKVLGSIPGVDKGILKFWGAYRPAFSENELKLNFCFFEKLSFFIKKIKFLDMNRYAQICTDMHRYTNIWTDTGLIHTDINRYSRYAKILTYWHIFKRYGRYLTIFTDTNIWADINIWTYMDINLRYSRIQTYQQI